MNKRIENLFYNIAKIDEVIAGQNVTIGLDPKLIVQTNVSVIESALSDPDILNALTFEQRTQLQAGLNRGLAYLA